MPLSSKIAFSFSALPFPLQNTGSSHTLLTPTNAPPAHKVLLRSLDSGTCFPYDTRIDSSKHQNTIVLHILFLNNRLLAASFFLIMAMSLLPCQCTENLLLLSALSHPYHRPFASALPHSQAYTCLPALSPDSTGYRNLYLFHSVHLHQLKPRRNPL